MPFSDGIISSRELCKGAVVERTIATDAVTSDAIADGAVASVTQFASGIVPVQVVSSLPSGVQGDMAFLTTNDKLYRHDGSAWILAVDGADITNGTIVASDKIYANSITAAEIAADTITAGQIAAGAISTSELAAGAVTAAKIAAGTITANEIAASTITSDKLSVTSLDAITANMGTLTVDSTLTMGTGGLLRTAASGKRIELSSSFANFVNMPIGDGETTYPSLQSMLITGTSNLGGVILTAGSYSLGSFGDTYFQLATVTADDTTSDGYIDAYVRGAGDVVPTRAVRFTTQGVMAGPSGTASLPSHSFVDTPDMGMYDATLDTLGFTTAGTVRLIIDATAMYPKGVIQNQGGTASLPSYTFAGDPDTGMYRVSADVVGWTVGGTERFRSTTSYLFDFNNLRSFALKHSADGTALLPTYTFPGDTNTGMYSDTADQIKMACGGADEFYLSTTQFVVPNVYNDSIAGSANVVVAINGRLQRATSARRYKTNIQDADLTGIELRPVSYTPKTGDGQFYGFIADDIANVLPDAGIYNEDGQVEDYDTRAVIAILAAKIRRLEKAMT